MMTHMMLHMNERDDTGHNADNTLRHNGNSNIVQSDECLILQLSFRRDRKGVELQEKNNVVFRGTARTGLNCAIL